MNEALTGLERHKGDFFWGVNYCDSVNVTINPKYNTNSVNVAINNSVGTKVS